MERSAVEPIGADTPHAAAYTIFGTLIAFKLVTALFILWLHPTVHGLAFLTAVNLLWFGLAAIPLAIGGLFWFRRLRLRAKRRRLIEQEWRVDPPRRTRDRIG